MKQKMNSLKNMFRISNDKRSVTFSVPLSVSVEECGVFERADFEEGVTGYQVRRFFLRAV